MMIHIMARTPTAMQEMSKGSMGVEGSISAISSRDFCAGVVRRSTMALMA